MSVCVRFFAAARAAAGAPTSDVEPAEPHLAAVLDAVRARHGDRLAQVLPRCAFLVDGAPAGRRDHTAVPVPDGAEVEVLPPFAGG